MGVQNTSECYVRRPTHSMNQTRWRGERRERVIEKWDVIDGVKTYDGVEHKTGQRENVAVMDHRWGK